MNILVYALYGHYSFNARDGGEPIWLTLADGYGVQAFFNDVRMIVGHSCAYSVEEAIYRGLARIVR
jgi:hypothetical protein